MENIPRFISHLFIVLTSGAVFALRPVPGYATPWVYKTGTACTMRTGVSGYGVTAAIQGVGLNQPGGVFFEHIFPSAYKFFLFVIRK
jgi:hypothetical protein